MPGVHIDEMGEGHPVQLPIGAIVKVRSFAFLNKYGGTGLSDRDPKFVGAVRVRITKSWYDWETGERAWAEAVSDELKDYLQQHSKLDSVRGVPPGTVFIGLHDVVF